MKHLLNIFMLTAALTATAQNSSWQQQSDKTAREEIKENKYLCGSNYLDYDRQLPTQQLTPAPEGYTPFYMSHYGRHGSRWLIGRNDYSRVVKVLSRADSLGKLTPTGTETLRELQRFVPSTIKRLGDLTTVGERQHHGIGLRMTQNFPEIFLKKGVHVDARSTVVPRCILSMTAECEELQGANPTIRIHNDVSESLQYYLNQPWEGRVKETSRKGRDYRHNFDREYTRKYIHPERLMQSLFNDPQWAADSIRGTEFMHNLFEVASNMQSHEDGSDLLSLFTDEEIYRQWCLRNHGWYLEYGAAPQTDGIMPFSQLNLLKNIIASADTVTQTQATLRFGHEVCVMPLACLLELDNCGAQVEDLEQLDVVWRNYRIFPMACNVQLIFYRPMKDASKPLATPLGQDGNDEILVKAMLNEREARLPIPAVEFPYYRWKDVRKYYLDKIARFEAGE